MTHLAFHILRVILSVYVAGGCIILKPQRSVSYLSWKTILEVKQAGLANVFYFCASLADDSSFESRTGARIPAEDCEGTCTSTA